MYETQTGSSTPANQCVRVCVCVSICVETALAMRYGDMGPSLAVAKRVEAGVMECVVWKRRPW